MVWYEHDKRILPSWQFTVFPDDSTHYAVGVGESIQTLVFQSVVRHLERLVAAGSLQYSQHRTLLILLCLDIFHHSGCQDMVWHTPFAQLVFYREVGIRNDMLITLRNKIRAHVAEICISTIIIGGFVILVFRQVAGYGWQLASLAWIAHDAGCGLCRIAAQYGNHTSISAETVGIESCEEDTLLGDGIQAYGYILV